MRAVFSRPTSMRTCASLAWAPSASSKRRATGRIVAIKVVLDACNNIEEEASCVEDMLREARFLEAWAGVPFIVGFHELFRRPASSGLGLVMEFVGPNMAKFLLLR
jgi:hypothetical protein